MNESERVRELKERIEQLEDEKQELQKALDVATELWQKARKNNLHEL